MTGTIEGKGFRLRRATEEDVEFLTELAVNDEISPFMAALSARNEEGFLEEVERGEASPPEFGRFVIEVVDGERLQPAGSIAFELVNRRSRIAHLFGLMLHPMFRGRGLARAATALFTRHLLGDLNFHRVQLEVYGYNERALRHFEGAGYIREGVRRKAYWRNREWVDGILFGLVREDLNQEES